MSLGAGSTVLLERISIEDGPTDWELVAPPIPSLATWVDAPAALPGKGWPLDGHHRFTAPEPGHMIAAEALLGRNSKLILSLPVGNGEEQAELHLQTNTLPTLLLSRGDGARRGNRIQCDSALSTLSDNHSVVALLQHNEESLLVTVNQQEVRCQSPSPSKGIQARPSVAAGLQRVSVTAVATEQGQQNAPQPAWILRLLLGLGGALLGGGLARRTQESHSVRVSAMLPLLAILPLSGLDLEGWFHGARIHTGQPLLAGLLLPVLASGAIWSVIRQIRWTQASAERLSLQGQAFRTVVFSGVLVCVVSALFRPDEVWAIPLFGVAGALASLLVWANVRAQSLPAFNWLSLACIAVGLLAAEGALRGTASGRSWAGLASAGLALESESTLEAGFVALESTRAWSSYPDQGYPVAPPPPNEKRRVVVFGGSSTGGAFDTDDLSRFYPARLEAHLDGMAQVVNQGVGGWTTLHVRRHIEARSEELAPNIAIFYIGHNDLLTRSRHPYSTLLEAWQGGMELSSVLGRSWLYRGLRFSIEASVGRRDGSAVPIEDAQENVASIVSTLSATNTRVLLVREVVVPSTPDLEQYARMLEGFSKEKESVAWLDPTDDLLDPAQGQVFVDDVHLTDRGHDLLARLLVDRLHELAWLETPTATPSPTVAPKGTAEGE
ncbi:MAG: SGNH/GDSL hydrolase family protein [Myxococcota bacterium]|nr:SGNH/GDSL hydrolase family protein [Myxococcota bacterium]